MSYRKIKPSPTKKQTSEVLIPKLSLGGLVSGSQALFSSQRTYDSTIDIKKYKTKSVEAPEFKFQEGGEIAKAATRQDSLDLYNNSKEVSDYYLNNDRYKLDNKSKSFIKSIHDENQRAADFFASRKSKGDLTTTNEGVINVPLERYRKDIDKYRYLQRETANAVLDLRAPMTLFDKRIEPQEFSSYKNVENKGGNLDNDYIATHSYDPLAVKPYDMLTPEELELRIKKYGYDGLPKPKESIPAVQPRKPQASNISTLTNEGVITKKPNLTGNAGLIKRAIEIATIPYNNSSRVVYRDAEGNQYVMHNGRLKKKQTRENYRENNLRPNGNEFQEGGIVRDNITKPAQYRIPPKPLAVQPVKKVEKEYDPYVFEDAGTKSFFDILKSKVSPIQYNATVSEHLKRGNPTITTDYDGGIMEARSSFSPIKNNINLNNPFDPIYPYIEELSHAGQSLATNSIGVITRDGYGIAKDAVRYVLGKEATYDNYDTPGTVEYTAHEVTEPRLRRQLHNTYSDEDLSTINLDSMDYIAPETLIDALMERGYLKDTNDIELNNYLRYQEADKKELYKRHEDYIKSALKKYQRDIGSSDIAELMKGHKPKYRKGGRLIPKYQEGAIGGAASQSEYSNGGILGNVLRRFQVGGVVGTGYGYGLDDVASGSQAVRQVEAVEVRERPEVVGPEVNGLVARREGRRLPGKEVYSVVSEDEVEDREAGMEDFVEYLNIREMSGRKDAEALKTFNRHGFVGAFQMGSMALEEAGLLKRGVSNGGKNRRAVIMDGNSWKGGKAARDAWMSSYEMQKDSAVKLAEVNRERLKDVLREAGVNGGTEEYGYLMAAHLGGYNSVKKALAGGEERHDANGVGIWNYRDGFINWMNEKGLGAIKRGLPKIPEIGYM